MLNGYRKAALIIALGVLTAGKAFAELPAVKLVTSPLITPTAAWAHYGTATTHTSGVAAWSSTPPEIQELARALGAGRYLNAAYATTVYEYVRNNVAIEFRFGLAKGARGAIIDQSGTAFDQAHLMMQLLIAGGVTGATYQVGQISLTAAQFQAWTGISNAATACQFLADGGIPATVNGATTCTGLSGALTSTGTPVVMGHIWILLNSQIYDPAYKVQIAKTSVALNTALGCGSTCASTLINFIPAPVTIAGTSPPVQGITSANTPMLETTLTSWAKALIAYIRSKNVANISTLNPNMQVEDLVGGLAIDINQSTANGSLLPSAAYPATSQYTWTDIPDQFRSTLTINFAGFNQLTYADETAGKRLRIFGVGTVPTTTTATLQAALYADSRLLAGNTVANQGYTQLLTLTVTHPYASSASYANEALNFNEPFLANICAVQVGCFGQPTNLWKAGVMTIIQGWGDSTESTVRHFAELAQNDVTSTYVENLPGDPRHVWPFQRIVTLDCGTTTPSMTPVRDPGCRELHQPVVAANWLAQSSRAMKIAGPMNNSSIQSHHSIGVVLSGETIGSGISLNIQNMLSVNSTNPTTTDRISAFTSIAAVIARLEGSIIEQQSNSVYAGDALTAMAEANASSVQFLSVTNANISSALTLLDGNYSSEDRQNISNYATASTGYGLIVPRAGHAGVVPDPTGTGSLTFVFDGVAAFAPGAGRIAFLSTILGWDKGAGGVSDPVVGINNSLATENYSIRDRKSAVVDLTTGGFSLTPAPDLVTGIGDFPHSLSYQRYYAAGTAAIGREVTTFYVRTSADLTGLPVGWTHSLAILGRLTNDGLASMGRTSALDASSVIAAMYAIRALNSAPPTFQSNLATIFVGNWLGKQLVGNVVTVNRPPRQDAFVKLLDGTFNSAPGRAEILSQAGSRVYGGGNIWNNSGLSYTLTGADGSVMALGFGAASTSINEQIFVPSTWTFKDGAQVSFTYTSSINRKESANCLTKVSNNFGRSLSFNDICAQPQGDSPQVSAATVIDDSNRQISFSLTPTGLAGSVMNSPADLIDVTSLSVVSADTISTNRYQYTSPSSTPTNRSYYRLDRWFTPSDQTNPYVTIGYDSLARVKNSKDNSTPSQNVTNYYVAGIFGFENQKRSETVDPTPLAALTTQYFDKFGRLLQSLDPLGHITSNTYDTFQRRFKTVYPELNSESFTYDLRHNVLTDTRSAKPGSAIANLVTTTSFPEAPTIITCVNSATCNQPATVKGPRTDVSDLTTYSYYTNGQLARVLGPAVMGGNAQTDYQYGAFAGTLGSISLLTGKVDKVDASTNRVRTYAYNTTTPATNHLALQSATVDPTPTLVPPTAVGGTWTAPAKSGALNLSTVFTFDTIGNPSRVDGPRTDVSDITNYIFDSQRRLTTVTTLMTSASYGVTRYCYDADGELVSTNRARIAGAADPNVGSATSSGRCTVVFNPATWQSETRTYYPTGDLKTVTDAQLNVTTKVYDAVGRQLVVTDPDLRQTATVYDAGGEALCEWRGGSGWSASSSLGCSWTPSNYTGTGPVRYATYSYSANGKRSSVQDADNNTTAIVYDGQDRLRWTLFGDPTAGTRCTVLAAGVANYDSTPPTCSLMQTYEQSGYDSGGNLNAFRSRKGDATTFTFDAANRNVTKSPASKPTVTYAYNLLNEVTSVSNPLLGPFLAHSTGYAYDAAGRKQSETDVTNSRTVGYAYADGVNRTKTTWPDGYFVTYSFDDLNRMQYAKENGTVELAFYSYDPLSRRQTLRFAGQATNTVGYAYEADSALSGLTHTLDAVTVSFGYSHNNSRQLKTLNASDSFYLPTTTTVTSTAYVPNDLNEYGSLGGQSSISDLNGNLQSWFLPNGQSTYTYDSENRLIAAAVGGSTTPTSTYDYDGLGRRASKTVGALFTSFLLDGDEEIAEYNSAGTLLRRYVTGPSVDDRIAHVEGSGITNPTKTYYHVNHEGSVIAMTDAAGNAPPSTCAVGTNCQRISYDEYGNGAPASGEQFTYTGRRFDPETGLYYYRARYYSPVLGRFLQTDPVGYIDNVNLYAYADDDPVNQTDSTGLGAEDLEEVKVTATRINEPLVLPRPRVDPFRIRLPALTVVRLTAIGLITEFLAGGCGDSRDSPSCKGSNVVEANGKPPSDAKDPNGAKAPGKPGPAEGFEDPKGGEKWVKGPDGRGGWEDSKGRIWQPTGSGGRAHGGEHWDVQDNGKHINVYPGGATR